MRGSCDTAGKGYGALAGGSVGSSPRCAVHLVELLGLRVVRLHLLVDDGPRRRDPVVVMQLAEVLRAQPVQRRAVELGGAADEVVDLRLEALAVRIQPRVRRDVAAVDEHVAGAPVLRLAPEPVAALEQQDALSRGGEALDERAAAGPAPDHDHVVAVHDCGPPGSRRSGPVMASSPRLRPGRWRSRPARRRPNRCGRPRSGPAPVARAPW